MPRCRNHNYIHSDLIANVFNAISQYPFIEKSYGTPKTMEQLIGIGKIIITDANVFADPVEKWNQKSSKHTPTSKHTSFNLNTNTKMHGHPIRHHLTKTSLKPSL